MKVITPWPRKRLGGTNVSDFNTIKPSVVMFSKMFSLYEKKIYGRSEEEAFSGDL